MTNPSRSQIWSSVSPWDVVFPECLCATSFKRDSIPAAMVVFLPMKNFNRGLILSNTVCRLTFVSKFVRTSKLQVSNLSTVCDLQRTWIGFYVDPKDWWTPFSIFRFLLTESVIQAKRFIHNFFGDSSDPVAATDNHLMVSTSNKTICSLSSYAKNNAVQLSNWVSKKLSIIDSHSPSVWQHDVA